MNSDINQAVPSPAAGITHNREILRQNFEAGSEGRYLIVRDIECRVESALSSMHSHPTIKIRIKKFNSYYKKYRRLLKSGIAEPLITDLVGIRIVCPFIEDLSTVEALIKEHFDVVETERKGHDTFKEFVYESIHLLVKIPGDIVRTRKPSGCDVLEIQIRTILQDTWAEVEHKLVYKAEFNPFGTPMKRKLAAVNACLSLADIMFQEIRGYQKSLNSQLGKRRESFYQKVEDSTDALLFSEAISSQKIVRSTATPMDLDNASIDDLLLDALKAHNENHFEDAIMVYSRILELKPEESTCALIYKHRGMAHFAQSKYDDAIDDFTKALTLDNQSYKTAYYRGVVRSVLKQYSEAIDDFTLSLEIHPFQAFCLFRRGQAYYHIGDYPQALSDCEASLSVEHNDAAEKFRELIQNKLKM